MKTLIQNISRLTHFDSSGKIFNRENCSILINENGIVEQIQNAPIKSGNKTKTIEGSDKLLLPLFVDCHTHTLFAGSRAHEFEMKCQGKSYLEIAKQGGGILSTQEATQLASDQELVSLVSSRLNLFISQGVRGIEIKTGYGLEHDEEIRHLEILNRVRKKFSSKIKIWITYLGPHAVKKRVDRAFYLQEICKKTLPQIANQHLADFVDIFVDEGFFSANDMEHYCKVATNLGLKLKAHIDEIKNLGGSEIAIKYGLTSVDHCRHTSITELARLNKKNIQVVFLPVTSFYIEEGFVNMNELRKIKLQPAISLDYNPGSQPALWWSFLLHLGMKKMAMTENEVLHATCVAPLKALAENTDDWSLAEDRPARFNLFHAKSISELAYRYGENLIHKGFFTP